jgi:hypothetical protein
MRNSSATTVLLGLLVISALLSIGLFFGLISKERQLRDLRMTAAQINNNRALINSLAAEAVEYSKKNPTIDPILEAAGVKPAKTTAASAAAKPAGK